jgi:hypothetical protein
LGNDGIAVAFKVDRRAIVRTLVAIVATLTFIQLAIVETIRRGGEDIFTRLSLGHLARQFNLEQEGNLTTWYSSTTLLLSAVLLALLWQRARGEGRRFAANWGVLCVAFVYLSADESASLHEAAAEILVQRVHASGIFYYAWVILALPLVVLFAVYNFRFLLSLSSRVRKGFIAAGSLYVGGALGLEMVEGQIATSLGTDGMAMQAARTLEEVLELSGIVIFIDSLLFELVGAPTSVRAANALPAEAATAR